MTDLKTKLRTVNVNSRGQLVIPEDIRKDLGIDGTTTLILIKKEGDILLKKENTVVRQLEEAERKEDIGWIVLGEKSLGNVWDNAKDEKAWKRYL